jgi:thiol:disulfide interchange protein DsbD
VLGGNRKSVSTFKAFSLASAYSLGIAVAYGSLGILVGSLGAKANISILLQKPWVLALFAAIFALLALSIMGVFHFRLPGFIQQALDRMSQRQKSGYHFGVFMMGLFSALVVSACALPLLTAIVAYIAAQGSWVLGGTALFVMGIGSGIPLIIIVSLGARYLPKTGTWMKYVNWVLGFLLLAVAIWLLERILPAALSLILWGMLLLVVAINLGVFNFRVKSGWQKTAQAMGVGALAYGVALIWGAAQGNSDPLRPLASPNLAAPQQIVEGQSAKQFFNKIENMGELQKALSVAETNGQWLLVDIYADWCTNCQLMERYTWPDPKVQAALKGWRRVKLDITEFNADGADILKAFNLAGPPALIFFNPQGKEVKLLTGVVKPDQLVDEVNTLIQVEDKDLDNKAKSIVC